MKKMLVCFTVALAFCFVAIGSAQADNHGPAEMILQTKKAKKPVKFPHAEHQKMMKCSVCHHTETADGKQGPYVAGEEKKCETCHNSTMANKKLNSFMKAGHARCKTCHKKGYEGKKGPTKCKGCHTK